MSIYWQFMIQNKEKQVIFHTQVVHGVEFVIENRYRIIDLIAIGSSSYVAVAKDTQGRQKTSKNQNQNLVVIKKIPKFSKSIKLAKKALRELKLVRLLSHPNLIGMKRIMYPQPRSHFHEIYLVLEMMDVNLQMLLESEEMLEQSHRRFFMYQLLRGLKYLHSGGLIHGDLKTQCILVNAACDLKITEMGVETLQVFHNKVGKTRYQTQRQHNPPQVLLESNYYTRAIDIWASGCIFVQILTSKPFLARQQQLFTICQRIGTPDKDIFSIAPEQKHNLLQHFIDHPQNPQLMIHGIDSLGLDLIRKMLTFNPKNRITAQQALAHPYFEKIHQIENQPGIEALEIMEFQYELIEDLKLKDYVRMIYDEVMLHHSGELLIEHQERLRKKREVQYKHELMYMVSQEKDEE